MMATRRWIFLVTIFMYLHGCTFPRVIRRRPISSSFFEFTPIQKNRQCNRIIELYRNCSFPFYPGEIPDENDSVITNHPTKEKFFQVIVYKLEYTVFDIAEETPYRFCGEGDGYCLECRLKPGVTCFDSRVSNSSQKATITKCFEKHGVLLDQNPSPHHCLSEKCLSSTGVCDKLRVTSSPIQYEELARQLESSSSTLIRIPPYPCHPDLAKGKELCFFVMQSTRTLLKDNGVIFDSGFRLQPKALWIAASLILTTFIVLRRTLHSGAISTLIF